jgi:hypothetical protein
MDNPSVIVIIGLRKTGSEPLLFLRFVPRPEFVLIRTLATMRPEFVQKRASQTSNSKYRTIEDDEHQVHCLDSPYDLSFTAVVDILVAHFCNFSRNSHPLAKFEAMVILRRPRD